MITINRFLRYDQLNLAFRRRCFCIRKLPYYINFVTSDTYEENGERKLWGTWPPLSLTIYDMNDILFGWGC